MNLLNYTEIETFISKHRLNSYRSLSPASPTSEIVGIYYWNKALCASLYPAMQCFEVTLRNAIHEAASSHFNNGAWYEPIVKKIGDEIGRRGGWPLDHYRRRAKFTVSEQNLKKAKQDLTAAGKSITPSGVIAELTLGFWVTLFTNNYEDFHNKQKLWPNLLRPVFKNAPSKECKRYRLHDKFKKINNFRNRLSHHEPLWKTNGATALTNAISDLRDGYNNLLDSIGYMSNDRYLLIKNSAMCKEFERLCSLNSVHEFMDDKNIRGISIGSFKKDIRLHLKKCSNGSSIYIKGRQGKFFRIIAK